jgi:tetraacyldisaccharide 4'-kinase
MNPLARLALFPATQLFGIAAMARSWLYSSGVLRSVKVGVPVISVGNVTVGGTGKTAVVLELLKWCESQGLKPGVVSRGYKRKGKGVERVMLIDDAALLYGDEPTLMAQKFPNIPVYVGARRRDAAAALLANHKVDIIFADDAFQHRALWRDLDIVLIDATEEAENYQLLPAGRGREKLSALNRAQFVILTKTNLVPPAKRVSAIKMLEQYLKSRQALIECKYIATRWIPLTGGEPREIKKTDRVFLVSGLGNPEAFRTTISAVAKVVGHSRFADHHDYTIQNFEDVLEEFAAAQADYILTTEKDAVKLRKFASLHGKVRVALLEPQLSGDIKNLYDTITHLVR